MSCLLPAGDRDADHVVDGNRDDDDDDDHCDAMLPIKTGPLIRGRLTSQAVHSVPFLWVNEDLPLFLNHSWTQVWLLGQALLLVFPLT